MSIGTQKLGNAGARYKRLNDFIGYREFAAECRIISKLQYIGEEKSDLKHLQDNLRAWGRMKVLNDERYALVKRAILANQKDFEVCMPLHGF